MELGPSGTVAPHRPLPTASDEELAARVRRGDERAVTELLERYRGFALSRARSHVVAGGDQDDTVQEGMIGLYKAVRDYVPGHGTSFRSFAELCVTRQVLTAVKTATRRKHAPLNAYVPIDRRVDPEREHGLADTLADDTLADPLDRVVASDEMRRLRRAFGEILSRLETDVLALYLEGRSYQEIAELLDRRVKSVDNAIQRSKRKLEPHLSSPVHPWGGQVTR